MTQPNIVRDETTRLNELAASGLPDCYDGLDDYLCDYWPDFSWTPAVMIEQIKACLADPGWLAAAAELLTTRGFDFVKVMTDGLNQISAEFDE